MRSTSHFFIASLGEQQATKQEAFVLGCARTDDRRLYRFWLTTDMRRHLSSYTAVDGDNAEYTGCGQELLIGFLVATAILVPIYLGYFLLGLEAERLQVFASFPLIAPPHAFTQFAVYRAPRCGLQNYR